MCDVVLLTCLILVAVGVILLFADPRRNAMRWLSAVAFSGASGALSAVIGDMLQPWLAARPELSGWLPWTELPERLLSWICYYGMPYSFLLFSMAYYPPADGGRQTDGRAARLPESEAGPSLTGRLPRAERLRRLRPWLLALPIPVMLLFPEQAPIPYRLAIWWVAPYVLAGLVILAAALLRERHSLFRITRLLTMAAVVPAVLFSFVTMHVLPLFGLYGMWRYNAAAISFGFAVFMISSITIGFMGVRINIQKQRLEYSLRAVTSGTAILNHAIKNDTGKIRLFSEKIRRYAEETNQPELLRDIETILRASQHMQRMINRIQDQTQDVRLRLGDGSLQTLLEDALRALEPRLEGRIRLQREFRSPGLVRMDPVHMAEALNNLLNNAVEAMPQGGTLTVRVLETARRVLCEIRDTGGGMDRRQAAQALSPFYTTKADTRSNFGLGLSYAFAIVRKHGGTLEIDSRPGHGTAILLGFPKPKRQPPRRETGDPETGRVPAEKERNAQ